VHLELSVKEPTRSAVPISRIVHKKSFSHKDYL